MQFSVKEAINWMITVTINQLPVHPGLYLPLIMGAFEVILILFLRDGVTGLIINSSPLQQNTGNSASSMANQKQLPYNMQ